MDNELQELVGSGLEVWAQHQNVLEKQALLHLQSLTESHIDKNLHGVTPSEEGEVLSDDESKGCDEKPSATATAFDINKYFENQELLSKKHVHKRDTSVSEQSKAAAEKISILQSQKLFKQSPSCEEKCKKKKNDNAVKNSLPNTCEENNISGSGSDYCPSDGYNSDSDYEPNKSTNKSTGPKKSKKIRKVQDINESNAKVKDDGLLLNYKQRIEKYEKENHSESDAGVENFILPNGLVVPGKIWHNLYSYQQSGVRWLWDVHQKRAGGLLGDEMGLGKTVQIIAFLAAIEHSKISQSRYRGLGASLIVCPATIVHQWVKHFHFWWPAFRVALLHQSGTYTGNKIQLIRDINKNNGIIITTYESVLKYRGVLCELNWHYLILDEGHKIRNPNAKITVAVKQFKTPHKLILTGSPMQNNLQELWSLFDFIVPGRLGTLQVFMDHFALPITQGGYVNATPTQETTALLIATSLKDMITPYMLRRSKEEVRDCIFLPSKSEQILFCSLTDEQRDLYKGYLLSDHVGSILGRTKAFRCSENQTRANILLGITTLRKICNHPDIYLGETEETDKQGLDDEIPEELRFGYHKRSGKMIVVAALLKIWKKQGHRVLLFTQSRAMIDIFQDFLTHFDYKFLKMDGTTSVVNRQIFIDRFNQDTSYDVFLLTTRVGGLGVNLTGANRVIIYDPDWNPATDTQARERAWRIGQLRQVTVYRLLSAGTIEEKMYQRQVWKQLLSNKVLTNPKTQRFFKSSDLTELFSLQEKTDTNPETANIFRDSKIEIRTSKKQIRSAKGRPGVEFSEDKIQAMKNLARQIAKSISGEKSKEAAGGKEESQQPSPAELRALNRKKAETKVEEPVVNEIDDARTDGSFSAALEVAEKNCIEYRKGILQPVRLDATETEATRTPDAIGKRAGEKKKRTRADDAGLIDGEPVEGLVKKEIKKAKPEGPCGGAQDEYVLKKLFSKKGVHTALRHDVIVQGGSGQRDGLKVQHEARQRADMALRAIRTCGPTFVQPFGRH